MKRRCARSASIWARSTARAAQLVSFLVRVSISFSDLKRQLDGGRVISRHQITDRLVDGRSCNRLAVRLAESAVCAVTDIPASSFPRRAA